MITVEEKTLASQYIKIYFQYSIVQLQAYTPNYVQVYKHQTMYRLTKMPVSQISYFPPQHQAPQNHQQCRDLSPSLRCFIPLPPPHFCLSPCQTHYLAGLWRAAYWQSLCGLFPFGEWTGPVCFLTYIFVVIFLPQFETVSQNNFTAI